MYKNQDELSILQKQFEGAANQFPEMVYYTAMLSFEDYKTHGDLKRNVRFHGAENVSEVMKKHIDPWQVDLLGKEIHAWDNGRYVSPVVRDGPSNHYHWLVRPIGQSWDTLPAMQRIHTLTRQASIILKRLYGTIGGVSRASHRQSNYLSHWFMSMRDILICEKHEYSFIQEELEYLNKALHIALKTHDIELMQKLLSERPPTFDGISDVFLKSAFVCTILIDRLREKDINKPNVTEDGGNVNEEPTPPKEFVTPEAEQSASQKPARAGQGNNEPAEKTPKTDSNLIYQSDASEFYNIPKSTLSKDGRKTPGEPGYLWSGIDGRRRFYRKADLEKISRSRQKLKDV